jgi:hypothetical protein
MSRVPQPFLPVTPSGTPESGASRLEVITISLVGANVDEPVAPAFQLVKSYTVKDLTGAVVPTLKHGGVGAPEIPLAAGEVRANLAIEGGLYLNNAAGGGSLTLEIHGR